jgi:hypothetical protein
MPKKILVVLLLSLALTGCFGKKDPKIDFGTPTPPDIFKLTPTTGPNDAIK